MLLENREPDSNAGTNPQDPQHGPEGGDRGKIPDQQADQQSKERLLIIDNEMIERLLRNEASQKVRQTPPPQAIPSNLVRDEKTNLLNGDLVNTPAELVVSTADGLHSSAVPATYPVTRVRRAHSGALARAVSLASRGRVEQAIAALEAEVQNGEDPAEVHGCLGHLRFEQGNWSEAASHYAAVLEGEPDHPSARYNLALCLEKQGAFREAEQEFARSLQSNARWQAQLGRAMCLLQVGTPQEALDCIEEAQRNIPDGAIAGHQHQITFARAVALQRLGGHSKALDLYQPLVAENVDSPELLANLVTASLAIGESDRITGIARKLLDIQPQSIQAHEGLAAVALSSGEMGLAIEHCTRLTELCPNSSEAWFNLGVALHKVGRQRDAIAAYQRAIELGEPATAYVNQGVALQETGDWQAARQNYERALTLLPDSAGVLWNLALVAQQANNALEAERWLCKLVALDPKWEDAAFRLGVLQLEREDYPAALQSFESCLRKRDNWTEALVNLGLASWKLGDLDYALPTLRKALELDPSNIEAARALTAVAVERREGELAKDLYGKLRVRGAVGPELAYNLGLLLQASGDLEGARRCYLEAVENKPDFAAALVNLGHALEANGESEQARAVWSKAMAADPTVAQGYFDHSL